MKTQEKKEKKRKTIGEDRRGTWFLDICFPGRKRPPGPVEAESHRVGLNSAAAA